MEYTAATPGNAACSMHRRWRLECNAASSQHRRWRPEGRHRTSLTVGGDGERLAPRSLPGITAGRHSVGVLSEDAQACELVMRFVTPEERVRGRRQVKRRRREKELQLL